MYIYNKNDNSYTFSFDDLDIDNLINMPQDNANNLNLDKMNSPQKKPKKIEVINGGNDLDISPVSNYLEIEKPRNEKKENIVIPENK